MTYDNHLSLKPVDYSWVSKASYPYGPYWWSDVLDFVFISLFSCLSAYLCCSTNHKRFTVLVLCWLHSVFQCLVSNYFQAEGSIDCLLHEVWCQRDSFHKTFMRPALLFASIGVSVRVALTKGPHWFLHWFLTTLSSFSPSQWQTFCGEKKVRLDCFCFTIGFINLS